MLPLLLLPLGFFALTRSKTKTYRKAINSNTGLYISSNKIEIINKRTAFGTIQALIDSYRSLNYELYEEINVVKAFEFVVKRLNKCLYVKMINRKLNKREQGILSILFRLVFARVYNLTPYKEEFLNNYFANQQVIIWHLLGIDESNEKEIEKITDEFEVTQHFP